MRPLVPTLVLLMMGCGPGAEQTPQASTPSGESSPATEPRAAEQSSAERAASVGLQTGERPCDDRARVEAAVQRALQSARGAGVAVDDCGELYCPGSPVPEERSDTCRVVVTSAAERWQVRIEPTPTNGAPDHYEAWVSEDASEVARTWIGASTWALTADGQLRIMGVLGHRIHAHGGDAAQIGSATFRVHNRTSAEVHLSVTQVQWLTSPSCEPAFEARAELASSGVALGSELAQPSVDLPAGTSTVTVGFAPQSAYYSYCDRFAARVVFDAGGQRLEAVAETSVSRIDPGGPGR